MIVLDPFGPVFYEFFCPLGAGNREPPHYAIEAPPLQGYGIATERIESGPDSTPARFRAAKPRRAFLERPARMPNLRVGFGTPRQNSPPITVDERRDRCLH